MNECDHLIGYADGYTIHESERENEVIIEKYSFCAYCGEKLDE